MQMGTVGVKVSENSVIRPKSHWCFGFFQFIKMVCRTTLTHRVPSLSSKAPPLSGWDMMRPHGFHGSADTESDLNEGPPVPSGVHALPSGEILGVEQQKCPDCTGLMTYSFCSFGVRRIGKTNSNSNTQIVFFCFADTAYIQDYTRLQDVTKSIGAPVLCRTPCAKHNLDQLLRKKQWQPLRSDTPCGCFCFFRFAARMTANESCASNGVCHSKLIIQVAARSKAAIYQPECAGLLLKTLL